jgi:uncharacterized membrane protein
MQNIHESWRQEMPQQTPEEINAMIAKVQSLTLGDIMRRMVEEVPKERATKLADTIQTVLIEREGLTVAESLVAQTMNIMSILCALGANGALNLERTDA